jgi:hypothetical protein
MLKAMRRRTLGHILTHAYSQEPFTPIPPACAAPRHWSGYLVIKTIKGRRYRYRQQTLRQGKRVRTRSQYISPEIIIGYHGTFAKFERFDAEHLSSANDCGSSREGFFSASNPRVAASYASTETIDARIAALARFEATARDITKGNGP